MPFLKENSEKSEPFAWNRYEFAFEAAEMPEVSQFHKNTSAAAIRSRAVSEKSCAGLGSSNIRAARVTSPAAKNSIVRAWQGCVEMQKIKNAIAIYERNVK